MSDVTPTTPVEDPSLTQLKALLTAAVETFAPCIKVNYDPREKKLSYNAPPEMEAALLKVFDKYIKAKPDEDTIVE